MERVDEPRLFCDEDAEVQHIINVLKVTPRCSSAGQSAYNGPELNRMDVHVKVEVDGGMKVIRRSGSADFDSKLKMAREVRRRVEEIVGKDVVASAEERMMNAGTTAGPAAPAPEFSQDELDWLSEWMDEQHDPSKVAHAEAEAALLRRRAGQAGAATLARLQETQLLHAKARAAQLRVERALRDLEHAQAALPATHDDKRPRPAVPDHPRVARGGTNPPHWEHYHSYSQSTYQKLETEEQDRCAVPIDREKRERALPPGDESRGWHNHWRRGIFGKLRGWAAGSLGAIIVMLATCARHFDVVDEVRSWHTYAHTRAHTECMHTHTHTHTRAVHLPNMGGTLPKYGRYMYTADTRLPRVHVAVGR